jgi:hypothetical protein
MTYAERVDLGDFPGVADLFDGATYRSALGDDVMVQEGRDAVLNTFETMVRRYDDGTPRTKHVTTNVMVEVDGNTATARSYYTVMQQTDVLSLQPII